MAEDDRGAVSGGAEALSEEDRSPEALEDNITLSFLDKLKCMMYSKVERDAFLIEKLEKEEKKKGMRTRALALHQQGWSWTKIATELGCHRTTVMRLVHKWQQTGCIADLPHRRRPRALPAHQPQHHQPNLLRNGHQLQQPLPAHHNSNSRLITSQPFKPRWQEENRKTSSGNPSRNTTITVRRRLKELRAQLGIRSPGPPNTSSSSSSSSSPPLSPTAPPPPPPPPPPPAPPHPPSFTVETQRKPPRTLQEIASFTAEELGHIVYSDMKIFLADREGGVRVWRLGQPPLDSYSGLQDFFQKGGLSATFWVCISGSGKKGHMLHIPNELTEERYVQILHNGLLPSAAAIYGLNAHRFLFAQDKASIQASPVVEDFLAQQQVQCAEWPARSADLNPVELLWAEVERLVPTSTTSSSSSSTSSSSSRQSSPPRNVPELVQLVRQGYEAVSADYIQWLVAPVRITSLCQRMMRSLNRCLGNPSDHLAPP